MGSHQEGTGALFQVKRSNTVFPRGKLWSRKERNVEVGTVRGKNETRHRYQYKNSKDFPWCERERSPERGYGKEVEVCRKGWGRKGGEPIKTEQGDHSLQGVPSVLRNGRMVRVRSTRRVHSCTSHVDTQDHVVPGVGRCGVRSPVTQGIFEYRISEQGVPHLKKPVSQ